MQRLTTDGRRPIGPTATRLAASWLAAALGGLLVLACGGVAQQPVATSAQDDGQHVDLRLGYLANLTHATALVAVRKGILAGDLGSNVTLKTSTFNAGPDEVE